MKEKWKAVSHYEGLYSVSNQGRVRSDARVIRCGNAWGGERDFPVRERILKPGAQHRKNIVTSTNVKLYNPPHPPKTIGVHRLVLEAFVGPCPPGMECCHEDGNPLNNQLDNLRWDTPKSNMADRDRHGRHDRGESSVQAKLKEADIPLIRKLLKKRPDITYKDIGDRFDVDAGTIYAIHTGRTWKHVL